MSSSLQDSSLYLASSLWPTPSFLLLVCVSRGGRREEGRLSSPACATHAGRGSCSLQESILTFSHVPGSGDTLSSSGLATSVFTYGVTFSSLLLLPALVTLLSCLAAELNNSAFGAVSCAGASASAHHPSATLAPSPVSRLLCFFSCQHCRLLWGSGPLTVTAVFYMYPLGPTLLMM